MLGWEPREYHEYRYDADGRTSLVVVTREVEWDDEQRQNMLDLAEYEAGVGRCGMHHDWTMDPDNTARLTFEEESCPACAAWDRRMRFVAERDDKQAGDKPDPSKPRPGDGRVIRMRALTPAEEVLAKRSR